MMRMSGRMASIAATALLCAATAWPVRAQAETSRQALQFDGKGDYVVATLSAPLAEDLTLEAWICTDSKAGLQQRILALSGPEGSLQICINGGRLVLDNEGGPTQGIVGPGGLNDGRWHHVLVKRYERTTYAFYLDGVSVGNTPGTTPSYTTLYIGTAPGKPYFEGYVDEVRVYNRCITDAEGVANYRGETSTTTDALGITRQTGAKIVRDGLVGWWKLDGDLKDSIGQQHGKIVGAPRWAAGRGDALFDTPRISARYYPGPGVVSVDVDTRMMGVFPPDAAWEAALLRGGAPVAQRVVKPIPPALAGEVALAVPNVGPGDCDVRVRLVDAQGKLLVKEAADKVTLTARPAWVGKVKVLNNFVWELLNVSRRITERETKLAFATPRPGWVFFAATAAADLQEGDRIEAVLESASSLKRLTVHTPGATRAQEAMRFLPAGDHTLTVAIQGKAALSSLVVRRIPEILFDEYLQNHNFIKSFPPRDVAFMERSGLFDNLTTLQMHGGHALPPHGQEWLDAGKRITVGNWIGDDATPEALSERWLAPLAQPWVGGIAFDEFMQYTPLRTAALKRTLADPRMHGKYFYAWCCSPLPERGGAEGVTFLRTLMDAGHHPLWERYLPEPPNEAEGWHTIDTSVRRDVKTYWLPMRPDALEFVVLALGNFMSTPPANFDHQPGVDFKVWMDMQYNLLANDPMFFGLGGLAEWTSGYADEEYLRWAARLYRHYAIEGRTEMLSPKYGFTFALPHLRNGDFSDGLKEWIAAPSEGGGVEAGRYAGFSALQGRYPETAQGNTFARMKRSAKAPNRLTQPVRGLVPGKLYSLKIISADYGDLMAGTSARKSVPVTASMQGVEFLDEKTIQDTLASRWSGAIGPFTSENPFFCTYQYWVFRATKAETVLTLSDWLSDTAPGGPIGQETAFNYVQLQPYLED